MFNTSIYILTEPTLDVTEGIFEPSGRQSNHNQAVALLHLLGFPKVPPVAYSFHQFINNTMLIPLNDMLDQLTTLLICQKRDVPSNKTLAVHRSLCLCSVQLKVPFARRQDNVPPKANHC